MIRRIKTAQKKKKLARLQQNQIRHQHQARNPYFDNHHSYNKSSKSSQSVQNGVIWLKKDGWALLGIFSLIAVTAWYFGLYTNTFKIKEIEVNGTQFINSDEINSAIDGFKNSRALLLFKRDNYWTLRPSKLESYMIEQFSNSFAFENIEIQKDFPKKIIINISERIPSVAWIIANSESENIYSVDLEGYVAQKYNNITEVNELYPIIRDHNRDHLEPGWQVISPSYINFLLQVNEEMPDKVKMQIDSYIFPNVECQERQYVAEKIFQQEILESASDEYREKKRNIQELFQQGALTIDQSLDELEHIKNGELAEMGEFEDSNGYAAMQWESVFVPVECDFVKIATELHVILSKDDKQFKVYLDTTQDLNTQINNLLSVLQKINIEQQQIEYIDVRLADRVFYK